jgi:hypothetical protein
MEKTMTLLEFYGTTFTSSKMPEDFQRQEVFFTFAKPVVFGFIASCGFLSSLRTFPVFLLAFFVATLVLHTIQQVILFGSAERQADGSLYIGPSVQSANQMIIFFLMFALSIICAALVFTWMGLMPSKD